MILTTEPAFYDAAMTSDGEPAMLPLEQSPWHELYRQASWMINTSHPVVDLGCGTGRFAEQLNRRNQASYVGVDFSPATIEEAARYSGWKNFRLTDLREWRDDNPQPLTVYTCLETLEHLEDDVSLVERIPVGHEFIFSVPNFHDEAHLRVFEHVSDAWHRYGHLLQFRGWQLLGEGPRYHIHLYRTIRRSDSW